jgi:hypothetical protein
MSHDYYHYHYHYHITTLSSYLSLLISFLSFFLFLLFLLFLLLLLSNSGIGRGIALSLARDGAKVVVNYQRDAKAAEAVVAAIKTIPGGSAVAVQADVSVAADVDKLLPIVALVAAVL